MIETSCITIDFVSTLILKNPMSYSEIIPLRVQTNLTSHHIQNIEWYEIMVKGSALYDVKDGVIFSYTQPILLSYLLDFLSALTLFCELSASGLRILWMTSWRHVFRKNDNYADHQCKLRLYLHNSIHHPHILSYIDMWNCFPYLYNQHYHHSRQCRIHIHQRLKVELQPRKCRVVHKTADSLSQSAIFLETIFDSHSISWIICRDE